MTENEPAPEPEKDIEEPAPELSAVAAQRLRNKLERFARNKDRLPVRQPEPNINRRARRFLERQWGISLNGKQWRRLRKHLEITVNDRGVDEILVREEEIPFDGLIVPRPEGRDNVVRGEEI